ncbi:MAG: deoxyribodipyrimidine photo-lyase [Thermoleophilaceae bacterium]|nr:deoxyribodipyrimidine photo-lyase [Thermoleophilaceae bacterium]
MSRDQRVRDNHGLLVAAELGRQVHVVFCLLDRCGAAARRHFDFMLDGLEEVERDLAAVGIPFTVLLGDAAAQLPRHVAELGAGAVTCDFSPLGPSRRRRESIAASLDVPLIEVDSHNIVPAWVAADKHVYAAQHLRGRHAKLLPDFLVEIPELRVQVREKLTPTTDWEAARAFVRAGDFGPALTIEAGEAAARKTLDEFLATRLTGYAERRGRPDVDQQSGLSPYFHFGQLSCQRAVLEVQGSGAPPEDIAEFVGEAVTWRELSDNFCLHVDGYATADGFPNWARATLSVHSGDAREVIYSLDAFEQADTHDVLWNAAQLEMVRTGRMHNYMRMYWAKKILEWSESPAEATRIAVLLNDRYELDGRDPNGYAGVAWSIGGVHDRPWKERAVYGKIRYMNENGARRKFDVDAYIRRVAPELLDAELF